LTAYRRRDLGRLGLGAMATVSSLTLMGLAACGKKPEPPVAQTDDSDPDAYEAIDPKLAQQEGTIEWAVSGRWRNATDKARDKYRHPIEVANFFEISPQHTVVDMWPGVGYASEILGPYLTHGKGRYIAALFPDSAAATSAVSDKNKPASAAGSLGAQYKTHFGSDKKLYGAVEYSAFGPDTGALLPAATADCVLFLLVIQDWMSAGIAEKAFTDAFAALKPGGILGVEQHRADIGTAQDPAATNGYVQEPFVRQLATEAGFTYVAASEINANPKDDKDHPFGVWTLPPQRLTAPRGQPANPEWDSTLYESIGESDRMTLKFRKPQ
jgi:predicted methyltransferase